MGFLKRLFGKPSTLPTATPIAKDKVPVYPMIKNGHWRAMSNAKHLPFVKRGDNLELAIVFAQDAGDNFEYITENDIADPAIRANFGQWQRNIDQYPFEIEISERLDKRVIFASGNDHSSEKILSAGFLQQACAALRTDRLLIAAPRRRCLMITSYHEEFQMLETFFHLHFIAYGEEEYGNEVITDMVFVASQHRVEYAAPLGFRMHLYEKDGQRKLVYNTTDDLFDEHGQINFQQIIERNKIPVLLPG